MGMLVLPQYPVRQRAVSQQLYRAVEVPFQPFFRDIGIGMVIQCFVDAGDGLDLLQHCADVMADEDDGAFFIDFCQQFVEAGFKALVDVRAGLIENHDLRVGDDGTTQKGTLQLSAAQGADGTLFHAFQPHAGYYGGGFFAVLGGET